MGTIRIGVSGWSYDEWRGSFYPDDLPRDRELAHVAEQFDTVEVNGTFYALTDPGSVRTWDGETPRDFVLAVKGSRFITHNKRLSDTDGALANFLASGILDLGRKLGPILWQLPPDMAFDRARVERFLASLPHDTESAAAIARRHDDRVEDVSYGTGENHRLRHVLEPRHESFLVDEFVTVARTHGVAIAFSHSSEWPYVEELTAGFAYVRLHGPKEVYASAYGDDALADWAERIGSWRDASEPVDAERITDRDPPERKSRDVYVYFDNTASGHAPKEALALAGLIDAA